MKEKYFFSHTNATAKKNLFQCPMHPEVTSDKPGNCTKCGMKLVKPGEESAHHTSSEKLEESYKPLIIIIALITFVTFNLSARDFLNGDFAIKASMSYFMAGFFLVFSAFKFLDIDGFAQGYSTYDLLARKFYNYGYIYPFLEYGLGMAYLLQMNSIWLHIFTFVLMGFSGLGILNSMLKKRKFQCACLGTFLKVPLTKVTLIEDFGMALMALLMLLSKTTP